MPTCSNMLHRGSLHWRVGRKRYSDEVGEEEPDLVVTAGERASLVERLFARLAVTGDTRGVEVEIVLVDRVDLDERDPLVRVAREKNRALREQLGERWLRFTDDQRRHLAVKDGSWVVAGWACPKMVAMGLVLPRGIVQPFEILFSRDDMHIIVNITDHPAYEAVEAMIRLLPGQPPRVRASSRDAIRRRWIT